MTGAGGDITPDMAIRDAMLKHPATRAIFLRHKLDTCCGGAHSIATAALARGLDPDLFLAEVRAAAEAEH
jgi:iron-sulfur cluster repair protein YtfE (RIC family)